MRILDMFVEVIFCLLLHVVPILLFIHVCKKAWGNWGCDRYNRHDKRSKLPAWILSHLRDAHLNLSTDMSLYIAREVCHYIHWSAQVLMYLSMVLAIQLAHSLVSLSFTVVVVAAANPCLPCFIALLHRFCYSRVMLQLLGKVHNSGSSLVLPVLSRTYSLAFGMCMCSF